MTRRVTIDAALLRRARSIVESKRPKCPSCSTHAPHRRAVFFLPFGHRCPHGEPCPGWIEELSPGVERCRACVAETERA